MYSNNGMINRRLFGTLKKKKPLKEREGPAATLGGGKFSRGALNYLRTSHSPTPWQISRGSSCAPTVKKPPRGALGNTERLHSTQARCFSSLGLRSITWTCNIPTMTQPSKKRTPCPHTLSSHPVLTPCPHTLSSHPVLTPCPHTLSSHPVLTP